MLLRRIYKESGMSYVQKRKLIGGKSLESYGLKMETEIQFFFPVSAKQKRVNN